MGLLEESSYEEDMLKSILYITSTGAKDVGSYGCSQVASDLVDIDEDPDQALHVFVIGSSLTPMDTSQVLLLPSSQPLVLPCTPSHTAVTVRVTANGQDVTDLFMFDPVTGLKASEPIPTIYSSFTCYFTYNNFTESLHLVKQVQASNTSHIMVTIHTNQDTKDMDTIEIVCKVVSDQPVEIYWTVPGMEEQLHQQELSLLGSDKYSIEEVVLEEVILSTMMVEEMEEEDQGVYRYYAMIGSITLYTLCYSCRGEQYDGKSGEAEIFINIGQLTTFTPYYAGGERGEVTGGGAGLAQLCYSLLFTTVILYC